MSGRAFLQPAQQMLDRFLFMETGWWAEDSGPWLEVIQAAVLFDLRALLLGEDAGRYRSQCTTVSRPKPV